MSVDVEVFCNEYILLSLVSCCRSISRYLKCHQICSLSHGNLLKFNNDMILNSLSVEKCCKTRVQIHSKTTYRNQKLCYIYTVQKVYHKYVLIKKIYTVTRLTYLVFAFGWYFHRVGQGSQVGEQRANHREDRTGYTHNKTTFNTCIKL